jgi:hypothetical protein
MACRQVGADDPLWISFESAVSASMSSSAPCPSADWDRSPARWCPCFGSARPRP